MEIMIMHVAIEVAYIIGRFALIGAAFATFGNVLMRKPYHAPTQGNTNTPEV